MPVPTKPNEKRTRRDGDFTWEQFAKDCLLNRYVLVVGSEVLLNRNVNPEAEGNSQNLLLELSVRELSQANQMLNMDEELRRTSVCKCFNDLFKLNYSKDAIKESVLGAISNNDFNPQFDDEIEPSLMKLFRKTLFIKLGQQRKNRVGANDAYVTLLDALQSVSGVQFHKYFNLIKDNDVNEAIHEFYYGYESKVQ